MRRRPGTVVLIGWLLVAMVMLPLITAGMPARAAQDDPCAGLPPSRLTDGALAKVVGASSIKTPGAYLKPDSSRLGPVLRYLPLGTVVQVSGEPRCSFEGDRWWKVTLTTLEGYMTETTGLDYVLEPFSGEAPAPLPSTVSPRLFCIQPMLPSIGTPTLLPDGAAKVFRVVFGAADGTLQYADNFGLPRTVAQFDPPPLSVDLSPDGTVALVVTYNGVYWVELLTGLTVLMADAPTFGLEQDAYPRRAQWIPGLNSAAVEIEDTRDDVVSYPVWSLPLDGLTLPFPVDRGNQPRDGVRRNAQRDSMIIISANDILPFPVNENDEPTALLDYVPRVGLGDARALLPPAVSWAEDGQGFYTYIPASEEAPPDDPVQKRLWYVPLSGKAKDLGALPEIGANDYVIPAPNGSMLLLGAGSSWRIQNPATGQVVQTLPPVQYLFNWTPDSKGVVFTYRDATIGYLGIDGNSRSPYVPEAASNLYEIQWLPDGTTLFAVLGADGVLSFSIQRPDQPAQFVGLVSTVNAFSAAYLNTAPGFGRVPEACPR